MIHETAHKLESNGFRIHQPINDQDGTIGYGMERDGEKFLLVTKEYAYKGLASAMESLVKKAASADISILFYENTNRTFTVFDATYYAQNGAVSTGKSKTRNTRWLELPLSEGRSLEDYLGGKRLMTVAGDNTTLGEYQ
mgnify:CR=1 FL=1